MYVFVVIHGFHAGFLACIDMTWTDNHYIHFQKILFIDDSYANRYFLVSLYSTGYSPSGLSIVNSVV